MNLVQRDNKWEIHKNNDVGGWDIYNLYNTAISFRVDCEEQAKEIYNVLRYSEWNLVDNLEYGDSYVVFCKHLTNSELNMVTELIYTEDGWRDSCGDLVTDVEVTHYKVLPKFDKGEK